MDRVKFRKVVWLAKGTGGVEAAILPHLPGFKSMFSLKPYGKSLVDAMV